MKYYRHINYLLDLNNRKEQHCDAENDINLVKIVILLVSNLFRI